MPLYRRPYFSRAWPQRARRARPQYPYGRSMLRRYDTCALYPLEGTGWFFTLEHIGGTDTRRFLRALRSGDLLRPWKRSRNRPAGPGNIDWLACYDDTKPGGYAHQVVEQHVWLNRWHFLLPLAQAFLREGGRRYASQWFAYFDSWTNAFPAPLSALPDAGPGTRYVLRDMQVVCRLMVMIHSVAMFAGRGGAFRPDQWATVYQTIEQHARTVYADGRRQMADGGGFNHFLHKGTALVYAGTLFPEFKDAERWVGLGRRIMRWYLLHNTYSDGGSREACPTYSHFIARLYLDSYLLLKANRRPAVKGLRECIAAQYRFLADTATPRGRSLQWGDSFSIDAGQDIEIVRSVFPFRMPDRTRSVRYPRSQVAVLRDGETAVYIDAMPGGLWHIHRGKPHVELFYRGAPVLVDSGCVNYDREQEREGYLKTRAAHNVVVVEPVERDEAPGTRTSYTIGDLTAGGRATTATCVYRGKGTKYSWTRSVAMEDGLINIEDRLTARTSMRCTLHFHLAESRIRRRRDGLTARSAAWTAVLRCLSAGGRALHASVSRRPAIDSANRRLRSPDVTFRQRGSEVVFHTTLRLRKAGNT